MVSILRLAAGCATALALTACATPPTFGLRCVDERTAEAPKRVDRPEGLIKSFPGNGTKAPAEETSAAANNATRDGRGPCPESDTAANYLDSDRLPQSRLRGWSTQGRWSHGRKLGIALSGGGSKAAPAALGALAGLADVGLLLPAADERAPDDVMISSVSGGGYAAYHLFTQLAWYRAHEPSEQPMQTLRSAYADCLTPMLHASDLLRNELKPRTCNAGLLGETRDRSGKRVLLNAEQYKLKCAQDVMHAGACALDGVPTAAVLNEAGILVPTALSLPVHHLLNTLFDSGESIAPSAHEYRYGIGLTYGSVSKRLAALQDDNQMLGFLGCDEHSVPQPQWSVSFRPQTQGCTLVKLRQHHDNEKLADLAPPFYLQAGTLEFGALRQLRRERRQTPYWILQATATEYRSLWGWMIQPRRDIPNDTFEISPDWYGSRRYGFMPDGPDRYLSVLAATAAAAAFFDSNQQATQSPLAKTAIGLLLHTFDVDWGVDIPNYNVSDLRIGMHRALPFPLYWFDSLAAQALAPEQKRDSIRSAFIHLNDGGNSDNTGAYSLVRRGVRAVVVVDAAEDRHGTFSDLCKLATGLRSSPGKRLFLSIPGLENFDRDCEHQSYDLFAPWPHDLPVLLGCVGPNEGNPCVAPKDGVGTVTRLIVLKPRVEWSTKDVREAQEHGGAVRSCVQEGVLHTVAAETVSGNAFEQAVAWGPKTAMSGTSELRRSIRCDATALSAGDAAACAKAVPCEVARYFADQASWRGFPQNGTVTTTAASSPSIFTASRDMARHQIHVAEAVIRDALGEGDHLLFEAAIDQQGTHPVHSVGEESATDAYARVEAP